MPYKRVFDQIYSKATGEWKLKQTCKSASSAIRAMQLLQGLESGSITRDQIHERNKERRLEKKNAKL